MTCIVGIAEGGRVYLGGDSAGVAGDWRLTLRRDRKVFRNGRFVMGFTSSFRMGQLLAFAFHPPAPRDGIDPLAYMATDFVDAARAALKAGGFVRVENGVETGGEFLVGYAGRLFRVQSDFQVGENLDGIDACGSGAEVALGSLFSTRGWANPGDRLHEALSAAETFNAGVRGPCVFETLEPAE